MLGMTTTMVIMTTMTITKTTIVIMVMTTAMMTIMTAMTTIMIATMTTIIMMMIVLVAKMTTAAAVMSPSEVAEAFIAQLQDETNNGAVMKVGKEEGKPYHQLVVVDTSTRPYDRMVYKEKVFFCDIIEDLGKATATELQKKYGDRVSFRLCDVSDSKDLTDAFEAAVSTFGAVDICVNNAGIANEGIWDKMIAINQVGEIRGSLLAYEHMRRDKGGRGGVIINVASMTSEVAVAFMVQLRDEANNGAVMKVAKQDGKAYYQYLVMDTSTSPIDRMIEKEKIFMK
nr:hypothetical protein BaRGS_017633 [Batillaria attramentaria]